MTTAVKTYIRWMIRKDLPAVLEIEQASFEAPWLEEDFRAVLSCRQCIGMVAERGRGVLDSGPPAGFMIYELREREIQILNLAAHPAWRRQGIGLAMVLSLQGKLRPERRMRLTADVRESNLAAQLFFRAQGFAATAILRGHYEDTAESAYRFVYALQGGLT